LPWQSSASWPTVLPDCLAYCRARCLAAVHQARAESDRGQGGGPDTLGIKRACRVPAHTVDASQHTVDAARTEPAVDAGAPVDASHAIALCAGHPPATATTAATTTAPRAYATAAPAIPGYQGSPRPAAPGSIAAVGPAPVQLQLSATTRRADPAIPIPRLPVVPL
ncbi:uncharacterized protein BJ171DRAFT_447749, partial [Polychytrium aggregatum]|uniref:uncharacterized protein n=1 Tax=Polychytrium aggregatum TaxID=110093 RepID=UPI0022FE5590